MADNYSIKGDAFLQHFTNLQPIEQTVPLLQKTRMPDPFHSSPIPTHAACVPR